MNKTWVMVAGGIALLAGIFYIQYIHPTRKLRVRTEAVFDKLREATEESKREEVGYVLENYISPTAKIILNVHFFSLSQQKKDESALSFDKPSFIRFVDNVIYSMESYHFFGDLSTFELNDAHTMAMVSFKAKAWADGKNHYGGLEIMSRFSTDATCEAQVIFVDAEPFIEQMTCDVPVRIVPKAEEAGRISQDPNALKDLILDVK